MVFRGEFKENKSNYFQQIWKLLKHKFIFENEIIDNDKSCKYYGIVYHASGGFTHAKK